jgi:hypothetical protein
MSGGQVRNESFGTQGASVAHGGNMGRSWCASDKACSSILNALKTVDEVIRNAKQKAIAIIQAGCYECMD